MKKIIVTGGGGYIGSHVVVALHSAGYEPIIVDNFSNSSESVLDGLSKITGRDISCYRVDCCDENALRNVFEKEQPIEGVIHFAALKAVGESVEKPLEYYKNNIDSLITLINIMKSFDITNFVFSSSCTVYGAPDHIPVSETAPRKDAASPYGNTKKICEDIITDCVTAKKLSSAVLLRYFNPIGAHESALIGELPLGKPANLVPCITQAAAGLTKGITVFGDDYDTPDGTCVRDYIHVMDLARAHVASLIFLEQHAGVNIFNVGTGYGTGVKELIETFRDVTGVPLEYTIGPRRIGDIPAVYADATKSMKELNWKPQYTIKEALASAWKWQQHITS